MKKFIAHVYIQGVYTSWDSYLLVIAENEQEAKDKLKVLYPEFDENITETQQDIFVLED